MPFKIKLRRTKRYNVLSKSCFVSRIRLLNSSEIECNLSVDSTGLDCLVAVAQRLDLCETHYFGLWFIGKSQQARWVELEKSLKKQLDKFSMESLLYFGVMFYVPSVSYLNQSVTRFQYYLQLRKDVFEGRLHCTVEQYIRLAALAVQVEFKDYNVFETHDFLRNYMLFPASWVQDKSLLEELYHKVALESKALSGMPPEEAEILYIKEVELMDGYGQECFHVKDSHGNDITLHIFFKGIFVGDSLGKATACYRWSDIGHITHNKSAIVLELNKKEESVLFHTDDIENSKYISRYRHRENLVYSQPEIQERHPYMASYGPQTPFGNKPINPPEQMPPGQPASNPGYSKAISHTVSTPELANVPPQTFSAAHMFRNFLSRPPPPYPPPRPASSTPDLASHRHKHVSSSSPDLVTRKVQQSVKTFQEDSSPVVRQSLQEVSEPLKTHKHHPVINKRHSFEVMNNMVRGMEVMALKSLNAPLPRRNTLREQLHTEDSMQKAHEVQQLPMYHHKKTISDATMLIHSSDSEEEDDSHRPAPHTSFIQGISYSAQLQAALARIPNKPPPEYPGPRKSISNGALRHDPATISAAIVRAKAMSSRPSQTLCMSRNDQAAINGTSLGPSISEPDLTSVKERVKREPVKERPVSEMFSSEDAIVEREIMMRKNLQKQEMAALEAQKRPLMLAALNGLSVSRIPVPEDSQDDTGIVPMDERCKALGRRLEEGMVFTEYEQIPKRKADGVFTTAALPENLERNRVREVIPYEENRVELVPTKENHTGYINASHIKVAVGDKEWHYIATQGPLPQTFHDFWQMVWEQGVNVIAMLTAEEEDGRAKSHRYWPKLGSRHNSATYGKFKVTTNFRTDSGCYATTGLKIKHLLSGQERTVWHLQFTDWPDHGCPEEVQGFLSYLEEIQSVRRHANSMLDTSSHWNPPVLVHCSAGVGRTGVVILTELMMRCLEHNEKVEIPMMLKHLREQRMFMIQTIAQYQFVYQVLIQFLESSRLI
ncbi:tyrosine-protein phosphatase non-receptor type 14 [Mixophyes fleayi]|uniref:tyrosine-protein phosphatase non-receptor type 14 n=1 Tax=Mixophyes fleayi TaxID=3061075 RepID=UPI003F4DE8AE